MTIVITLASPNSGKSAVSAMTLTKGAPLAFAITNKKAAARIARTNIVSSKIRNSILFRLALEVEATTSVAATIKHMAASVSFTATLPSSALA